MDVAKAIGMISLVFLPLLPVIFGRRNSFGNYLIAIFHMWEFQITHKIGCIESHSLVPCSALIFSTCNMHLLDLVNWSQDHLHLALEILPYHGHLNYDCKKFLKIIRLENKGMSAWILAGNPAPYNLLSVKSQASFLTSLCLDLLIFKMGIMCIPTS